MSEKRKYSRLQDIQDEVNDTELQFGVEVLSPIKKSRSGFDYYNGKVNDGTKSLRLVGFDADSRDQLAKFSQMK